MSNIKYNDYDEFYLALCNVFIEATGDHTSPVVKYIYDAVDLIKKATPGFLNSYCSVSVHDNYKGGLPAHTVKVFSQLCSFMFGGDSTNVFYNNIRNGVDMPALIIGCIVHDFGKTFEYLNGQRHENSFVPHTLFGIHLLTKLEAGILSNYSMGTYLRLMAVIGQHHGDFGEKPQCIESYLIHLADYQETKLQILEEAIESAIGLGDDVVTSKYLPYKLNCGGGNIEF